MIVEQLINGIALGFVYVLIALGLTMVYGVLKVLHFAHGVIYMVGAFSAMVGILYLNLSFIPSLIFALVISGLVGVGIEKYAYRPLKDVHPITVLISGVGIAILLQNLFQIIFTSDSHAFPKTNIGVHSIDILGIASLTNIKLYMIIIGLIVLAVLYLFLNFTKIGIAIKAVSQDRKAAALMGINVNRIVMVTFLLGSMLAALAGIITALNYNTLSPAMGDIPGLKAFCVVVLGGLGSIPGTVLGGLILGIAEALSTGYLEGMPIDTNAIAFILLVVILLIKPSGIFGKNIEKV
ncbi:branched-chain amino acid ABC transporter permease [Bacillus sp. DTU_2020_1000418_1_SI_GHA_SEK_038]|uniref:branched-chain amino acid ABC transporter permease n=1 Tax=Bacillus sp. DTU_2020_1000418_1_SI_GHA_SEK_038 TaxID=3077585 RepID=UPI0028E39900|nr:branched-chain amino acid ABC transporter permease [Bacillus sp. DTU_2020_1000418_1_SI_GHA_SEK_038]WNS76359.1 branched-chain amino acid ABC transporter permease [Bacillus sp. DTU_2020_1000418_1_SI_GHA_SEK_038]